MATTTVNKNVLRESGVLFFPDTHTYLLGCRDLRGITSTLLPALFGDYTADIPAAPLAAAAARGTAIHEALAAIDRGDDIPTEYEEREYVRLRDALGLVPVQSEYIVTDGKHFASAIDKVYEGDIIADVKTTDDEHYAQWAFQLSWYAPYYHALNGRKVQAAYIIHLPKEGHGTGYAFRVPLVRAGVIRDLVRRYVAGEDIRSFAVSFAPSLPVEARKAARKIRAIRQRYEAARAQYEAMEATLREGFATLGVRRYDDALLSITAVQPSRRTTLDSAALRREQPAVYERYCRTSEVKGSVRITIKDKQQQQLTI